MYHFEIVSLDKEKRPVTTPGENDNTRLDILGKFGESGNKLRLEVERHPDKPGQLYLSVIVEGSSMSDIHIPIPGSDGLIGKPIPTEQRIVFDVGGGFTVKTVKY